MLYQQFNLQGMGTAYHYQFRSPSILVLGGLPWQNGYPLGDEGGRVAGALLQAMPKPLLTPTRVELNNTMLTAAGLTPIMEAIPLQFMGYDLHMDGRRVPPWRLVTGLKYLNVSNNPGRCRGFCASTNAAVDS
jgi:hypothetical protein